MTSIDLKKLIVLTAAYYGRELQDGVVNMYVADLAEIPTEVAMRAIQAYRKDPKNRTMFLPSMILEMVNPKINAKNEAVQIAGKIVDAIRTFGFYSGSGAKKYLGPVGWKVVELSGGWQFLCETTMDKDLPVKTAQWRDLALSVIEKASNEERAIMLGGGNPAPQLEEPK